ncbi:MAG: hypothetical protein SF162_15350 [bacterium]|nr:hypothetical protein [bacterium]
MSKRLSLLVLFVVVMSAVVMPAAAQETQSIAYGESVEGVMSNTAFEFEYTFEGEEGDIVAADVRLAESGAFGTPELFLLGPDGDTLIEFTGFIRLGEALVFAQLPESGEYTVILTRRDGRSGDDEGAFVFSLYQPQILTPGESVDGEINIDTGNQYYAIEGGAPATLRYSWSDANSSVPTFRVYAYEDVAPAAAVVTRYPEIGGSVVVDGSEPFYLLAVEYEQSSLVIYGDWETEYTVEYLAD